MNGTITHMRSSRQKHYKMPERQRDSVYQQADSLQLSSPWIKKLTMPAVDQLTLRHHLLGAGESLRIQTFHTLQHQNGNRYIQREAINVLQRDDDDLMIPNISTPAGSVAPVPVPYPNINQVSLPSQSSKKIIIGNKSAYNSQSQISQSTGDEARGLKGMVSNVNRNNMAFKNSSSKVHTTGSGIVIIPPSEETLVSRSVDDNPSVVGKQGGPVSDNLSNRINRNVGNGTPLSRSKQTQMESRFGTQFSDVRLHTDTEADALNQQLSARAFTIGNDIFFSHRANSQDDGLLSHELTHVVQQKQMSSGSLMTVGPADDHLERQAGENADSVASHAYALTFEEQRNQAIQRDFIDEFNLGNVAGVTGMGADISTGLSQLKNLALAQKLSMTAPQLTNITQAPMIGTLSKIAGPIGLLTGSMDMMNQNKPLHERIIGGMSALGGATGTASTIAGMFGSSLFSAGGAAGMSAGAGTALTGGGASLLSGAGAATALGSLGAVAGAGAGGYALGRLLDEGFGGIANLIAGDKKKDRTISGYGSRGMGWLDKKISGLWRDDSKPAYTQSIGWKLASLLGI